MSVSKKKLLHSCVYKVPILGFHCTSLILSTAACAVEHLFILFFLLANMGLRANSSKRPNTPLDIGTLPFSWHLKLWVIMGLFPSLARKQMRRLRRYKNRCPMEQTEMRCQVLATNQYEYGGRKECKEFWKFDLNIPCSFDIFWRKRHPENSEITTTRYPKTSAAHCKTICFG